MAGWLAIDNEIVEQLTKVPSCQAYGQVDPVCFSLKVFFAIPQPAIVVDPACKTKWRRQKADLLTIEYEGIPKLIKYPLV